MVHLTSRQHAAHLTSPQLVVLGISLQKLLQLVAQLTSRKRSLQPAVALVAPVTNKNERCKHRSCLARQKILRLSKVGGSF